jgi:cytochrome c oxidase assembly protein subunit 15
MTPRTRAFGRFAWSVLAFNLGVIAWGAYVRATGSGAGCGRHWPMCNGEVLPRSQTAEMAVEFTHRVTSGAALALVAALALWAFRAFPRGHLARRGAALAAGFMALEALLGAALVLFGLVAKDTSPARALVVPIHLTNTFLLLAALALTGSWASSERPSLARPPPSLLALLAGAAAAVLLAGATGGVAALGDTLFPAPSLGAGFTADTAPGSQLLLRLRVLHPAVASLAALACVLAARAAAAARPDPGVRRPAGALGALAAAQVAIGVMNVVLLAPVWLQLVHLAVADLTWIALVLTAAASLGARGEERVEPQRLAVPG